MPAALLPDLEQLVREVLLLDPRIVELVGPRISATLPDAPVFPLVTLTRVGGAPSVLEWVDSGRVQLDAWAATKAGASDLARELIRALADARGRRVPGVGVLTAVSVVLGPLWQPDPDTLRPRYLVDVQAVAHPDPTA